MGREQPAGRSVHRPRARRAAIGRARRTRCVCTRSTTHGGFYLDTDVEVLRSFEPLRRYECFLGFQYVPDGTSYKPFEMCVASGVMGARPRHPLVARCSPRFREIVEGPAAFDILGPQMATAVLIRAGLTGYSDTPVTIGGATILPKETFYPYFYKETFDPSLITARHVLGPSLGQAVVSRGSGRRRRPSG